MRIDFIVTDDQIETLKREFLPDTMYDCKVDDTLVCEWLDELIDRLA